MPWHIEERGDQFCVIKDDTGEPIPGGCHAERNEAESHLRALYASEEKSVDLAAKSFITPANAEGLRHMLIVTSNAYRDREDDIVSQKSLTEYVESCWDGEVFKGDNTLDVWHSVDSIGDIVYAEMIGPFLLEVARERPNALINLAEEDEPPFMAGIKSVWDALEQEKGLGASQAFYPLAGDRKERVYQRIWKRRTSVLPRWAAANYLTESEIISGAQHDSTI